METAVDDFGVVNDKSLIAQYFETCLTYGSLFVTSDISLNVKVVSELKHINDAQEEISIIPLDDELLNFPVGDEVVIVNESNNITFRSKVIKNHASKWITVSMPTSLKIINLRECKRVIPTKNLSPTNWIISYGEDGRNRKAQYEGSILDISTSGVAFKIKVRRLDGLYRGDQVEMNISESISNLSRVKGVVVHKTIAHLNSPEERYIKVGVRFDKRQSIDGLVDGVELS